MQVTNENIIDGIDISDFPEHIRLAIIAKSKKDNEKQKIQKTKRGGTRSDIERLYEYCGAPCDNIPAGGMSPEIFISNPEKYGTWEQHLARCKSQYQTRQSGLVRDYIIIEHEDFSARLDKTGKLHKSRITRYEAVTSKRANQIKQAKIEFYLGLSFSNNEDLKIDSYEYRNS